jgi:small subunit ribosomal protein S17
MKNIGLNVTPSKKTCSDPLCPFCSTDSKSLKIRGRLINGVVVSLKGTNRSVIERNFLHYVKKYDRYEKRHSRINAHITPCLEINVGDSVLIGECRPIAKNISYIVVNKVN